MARRVLAAGKGGGKDAGEDGELMLYLMLNNAS
jgi:hypothetical protein